MFRIKICGVRSPADVSAAVDAGADAIGVNFYEKSQRYCPPETAGGVLAVASNQVIKVGVFAAATPAHIRETARSLRLDLIQLHGGEPPEFLAELRGLPVMIALRLDKDAGGCTAFLEKCHQLRCVPRMVLIDAASEGQLGGTGKLVDWQALQAGRRHFGGQPLVLAGGLKPSNVAAAIQAVRPWAVDVASGVESAPGMKSAELIQQFVGNAKAAFADLRLDESA
jgi:phosphoribosylanthranilate isomerase